MLTNPFRQYRTKTLRWNCCVVNLSITYNRPIHAAVCSWRRPYVYIQCESKNPLWGFLVFFPKRLGVFRPNLTCLLQVPILTLYYKFLFNYLQHLQSYAIAIFSATTQFTSYAQNVHHRPKRTLAFSDIFPNRLGIFSPNFTSLLCVPIYVKLQISVQLSSTVMKLCHIKCDHPACVSANGGHLNILNIWWWSHLIWQITE